MSCENMSLPQTKPYQNGLLYELVGKSWKTLFLFFLYNIFSKPYGLFNFASISIRVFYFRRVEDSRTFLLTTI